ncbi:uncharacterized protein LOC129610269 [Condylostylus longicornis]|uniref:uncharacterized protein LOC129610269 n=1 Tax=Condylostylus longicornis TaxID=2530218 RepID=UPI00244DF14D|nr:uncharacterized protein LOC129610269 [Condylostylus longicornis]
MTKAIDIRTEWSRELNVEFINDYKKLKVIWDPKLRHLKADRIHAVKSLCEKYKLTPDEVRGRIKVLRTSFHREHIKVLKNSNSDEPYAPKWYGYELMKFIIDDAGKYERKVKNETDDSFHISDATIFDINFLNYEQLKHKESDSHTNIENGSHEHDPELITQPDIDDMGEKAIFKSPKYFRKSDNKSGSEDKPQEITVKCDNLLFNSKDCIDLNNDDLNASVNNSNSSTNTNMEELEKSSYKVTKVCTPNLREGNCSDLPICHCHWNNRDRDEFVIFGENVAVTLKNLKNSKSKIIAKHMINNILFEAQMGKFDQ